ncbi:histidine kinase [Rubrivivax sp. JA1029]|uniref:ATP-binding protein n=1 Tax=Rubrivivax sp. JA1029 TaxID=2894193 RepID=UPI001E3B5072|nr:ATP-binding protein [Rubrivivax sp. JA1029]MCC9645789.1 histidine kinase [Rubrivivax sp. JA1029]
MKNLLPPSSWSLGARLLTLALAPACAMALVVSVVLYVVTSTEVSEALEERGRFLSVTLAEAVQYGVVSGNTSAVEATLRGVAEADGVVAVARVLDADRRSVVEVRSRAGQAAEWRFEAPISLKPLDVDLYDTAPGARGTARWLGWVQVDLSPQPLLAGSRRRLLLGVALVLAAAALGAAAGLLMARRLRRPLENAMGALRSIRDGDYAVTLTPRVSGELGELQASIATMARAVKLSRQYLEEQVRERTRELQQAVERLTAADAEKRRLIARGNRLVEEERRRIAVEIHDELNAALVSIRLIASSLADDARGQGMHTAADAAERIARLTDDLYGRARAMVKQLRPEVLDALGLAAAVEEMVRQYDEIHPRCRFRLKVDRDIGPLSYDQAIGVYRLIQEALTNVVKHAEATQCSVTLARTVGGAGLCVVVEDNGVGMPEAGAATSGLGLVGMRERVAAYAGELTIEQAPGGGTRVEAVLPIASADDHA